MTSTQDVPYRDADVALCGFLAVEEGTDRRPGVLVIHGGSGLDAHAKGRAERFAKLGYVAFAADLFGAVKGREQVLGALMGLRSDRAAMGRRVQAGLDALRAQPRCDGQVAAVGYCFGGLAALEAAREGVSLDAAVSVHGALTTTKAAGAGGIRPRVLVCHGALDPHCPLPQVTAFVDEMNAAGADWQLIAYGGAMHGFTHETADGSTPGVKYDARSDARSSRAIADFLAEHFDGS
jgi:dienelactone hydrolase